MGQACHIQNLHAHPLKGKNLYGTRIPHHSYVCHKNKPPLIYHIIFISSITTITMTCVRNYHLILCRIGPIYNFYLCYYYTRKYRNIWYAVSESTYEWLGTPVPPKVFFFFFYKCNITNIQLNSKHNYFNNQNIWKCCIRSIREILLILIMLLIKENL